MDESRGRARGERRENIESRLKALEVHLLSTRSTVEFFVVTLNLQVKVPFGRLPLQ
jgi:hypothetical protein